MSKKTGTINKLSSTQQENLLSILKERFAKNMERHNNIEWARVQERLCLATSAKKLWSLNEMENTGGEPDIVGEDKKTGEYIFFDCSEESPKGRRSLCYDGKALASRKENKPKNNIMDMASTMGIEVLSEGEYQQLQQLGKFDTKTSSWIKTPSDIRALGGAIFADFRYSNVFIYHNGAESYYAGRAFRGSLRV